MVLSTTPTTLETLPETMYLKETISAAATSMKLNYVPLAMTAGVMILDEGTTREERVSFNGVSDNGDGSATFSDLGRGLAYGGGTAYATGQATAYEHTGNSSTARLVFAHEYFNAIPFADKANTFSAIQSFNAGIRTKTYATKALLDADLASFNNGDFGFYVTTENLFYRKEGGAWVAAGSNATPTATTSSEGKVELAIASEHDTPGTADAIVVSANKTVSTNRIYTPAYLTGGSSATSNFGTWSAVTDGSFRITVDGSAVNVDGIDFTGVTDMDDVASTIQTALRAATSGSETVVWDTDHFVITSGDTTSSSAITVTTTSTGTVGTDISGEGGTTYMDAETGQGVVTATVIDPTQDSQKVVALKTTGKIDPLLLGASPTSAKILYGDGTWNTPAEDEIQPEKSTTSDSDNQTSGSPTAFNQTYTILGNSMAEGDVLHVHVMTEQDNAICSNALQLDGNTLLDATDENGGQWFECMITFRTVGATASVEYFAKCIDIGGAVSGANGNLTLDTTGDLVIGMLGAKDSGAGTVNHITQFIVTTHNAPS